MRSTVATKLYSLLFFFLLVFVGFGQSEQDAEALIEAENYEGTLEIYRALEKNFLAQKNYIDFLRIRTKAAVLNQDLGEYEEAKFLLEKGFKQIESEVVKDTTVALVYHKLGVSHYYLEEYESAIKNWEKAIQIRAEYLPSNHNNIAKGYKNIGQALEKSNNLREAENAYKKSIDLLLSNPDRDIRLLGENYKEIGYLFSLKNDIELAETYYLSAQDLHEDIYSDELWNLGTFYNDLASFYLDIEHYQKVIEYSSKTLQIYESILDKYDEDYWSMADAYNNMGIAYLSLGEQSAKKTKFKEAILPLQKAININSNFAEMGKFESINRSNLAVTFKYLKEFQKAHQQIEKALTIDRQLKDNISLAINTNNRGEIYFDQKNYQAALQDFQTAIQLLVADFNSNDLLKNPNIQNAIIQDKISLVEILQNKVKTLRLVAEKPTYQQLALSTYDSLFVLLNLMQNEVEADGSKRFLAAKSKAIFEAAIQANLDYYNQTPKHQYLTRVFELAEQSKAVSLLDQLSESQAKSQANIPSELLQREQSLKRQIKTLEQEIFEAEKTNQSSVVLRTQLIANNRQLEKLLDTLEQQYSTYHQLKYALSTTNLMTIQETILAPKQAMIQYFVGDSSLFILYTDHQESKAIQKNLPKNLLQQIEGFRRAIIEQNMEVSTYQKSAYDLYKLLLKDVLPDITNIQRLIIIPDDILAYLPFEILTTEFIKKENDFRFLPYLLKQYAISYAYSASVLAKQQNYQSKAKKYLAAFAPSYDEELAGNNDQLTRLLVRSGNYNLPGALEEVKAVKELMGGDLFQETEATEHLFKSIAKKYKNLHLSMHGIVSDSFPLRSKLLFYKAQNDSTEDASLFAYELYNMQLNSDLVVLSACNTGMGQLQKGEGVMSLSHAFAYAGVASTVMSLWQVPDASTSTLIQDFYHNLKAEQPKDVAMQQAKLDFLENTVSLKQAHPFYWAALLNYGNQAVIDLPQKSISWLWGITGLGVLLLLFIFWQKRQV